MNQINQNIYKNFTPLPEKLSGWGSNDPFFEKILLEVNPNLIVEVGTWLGGSAINMANICKKHNLNCNKIYCIDTWLGAEEFWTFLAHTPERDLNCLHGFPQVYYQFLSNVIHNNAQDLIQPIPNTSVIGFEILKHFKINPDLIYIDGSHLENDAYQDIKNYYSILNRGGVIFGDDREILGLPNALKRISNDFNFEILASGRMWYIYKT